LGDGALRSVLRAKIHKAIVTQADPDYVGSITIDKNLTEKVGLWANEKVLVASNTSGNRLETYVIEGERGSGKICMNGPAAHLIAAGEEIVIMGFEITDEPIEPVVVLVDKENNFVRFLTEDDQH
jgi:aspartate 1-decarboxylase